MTLTLTSGTVVVDGERPHMKRALRYPDFSIGECVEWRGEGHVHWKTGVVTRVGSELGGRS